LLLVKAAGGGDSPTLLALREVRMPCVVLAADGYDSALDYLHRRGSFADRLQPDPEIIVVEVDGPESATSDFIAEARGQTSSKPCPVVIFADGVANVHVKEWYLAGANSVLPVDSDGCEQAIQSVAWYWLAYNRTPLQR
jgi:two-component system response regulator